MSGAVNHEQVARSAVPIADLSALDAACGLGSEALRAALRKVRPADVIRALALGEVRQRDGWRVLGREKSARLILGVLLGGVAFGRALLWGVHHDLAACVAVTVLVVCTWANTVGALIPLGAARAGVDPTVVSDPLITTLVDASGLFLYLTIARLMIAQLRG